MIDQLTQAQELAAGWIPHFQSVDKSINWRHAEREHSLWLDDQTLLVGRIDAEGDWEGREPFFADWKTISARNKNKMAERKAEYRLDPQMLTYGVLTGTAPTIAGAGGGGGRFLVRWAMKTDPCLYFYEWYSYSAGEVAWWRSQLLRYAARIRQDKNFATVPWDTNLTNCTRYGSGQYVCPFLEPACAKQKWDAKPVGWTPRGSHLGVERELQAKYATGVPFVVLDATRVETWLGCNEKYRREYVDNIKPAAGEALSVGIEFHDILGAYYGKMVTK